MAIIQKFATSIKNKLNFFEILEFKASKIKKKFTPIFLITFLTIFTIFFFISSIIVDRKNQRNVNNFKEITATNEFLNLTNFLFNKIKSPYEEINYVIKNNDTIEKILKKLKVNNKDIKEISNKLKQQKLSNIYSGRKLSLVVKKLEDGSKTIVNFIYPINNTTGINSEPASALYCPEQGFVGNVEITATNNSVQDIIEIEYVDDIPECEDCIAEIILIADQYILPCPSQFPLAMKRKQRTPEDQKSEALDCSVEHCRA